MTIMQSRFRDTKSLTRRAQVMGPKRKLYHTETDGTEQDCNCKDNGYMYISG